MPDTRTMPEALAPEQDSRPPSEEALTLARRLVREFHECFWFWRKDPYIATRDDVYAVVRGLREYGGHKAWKNAQHLWQCL